MSRKRPHLVVKGLMPCSGEVRVESRRTECGESVFIIADISRAIGEVAVVTSLSTCVFHLVGVWGTTYAHTQADIGNFKQKLGVSMGGIMIRGLWYENQRGVG